MEVRSVLFVLSIFHFSGRNLNRAFGALARPLAWQRLGRAVLAKRIADTEADPNGSDYFPRFVILRDLAAFLAALDD